MAKYVQHCLIAFFFIALGSSFLGCAGGGGGSMAGNEKGSAPVNSEEAKDYKKAILRCYKTGGSRVVKIAGKLNCY